MRFGPVDRALASYMPRHVLSCLSVPITLSRRHKPNSPLLLQPYATCTSTTITAGLCCSVESNNKFWEEIIAYCLLEVVAFVVLMAVMNCGVMASRGMACLPGFRTFSKGFRVAIASIPQRSVNLQCW
jgi:hypothetical protein